MIFNSSEDLFVYDSVCRLNDFTRHPVFYNEHLERLRDLEWLTGNCGSRAHRVLLGL